ncbi:DUF4184 family protein [Nocardia sp. NPDC050406]|uniref:DUF4184 family protein n=1 Tax=Nocardia sp. NPDC050406 TaxID=3364318 RepID=UPI00379A7C99
MPFTLAHPAAILPLRRYLSLPALVAGSIAPDIPYYLPLPGDVHSHSIAGLFGWDLLFGLILLALFQALTGPVLALAPAGWRNRITRPHSVFRPVRQLLALLVSVITGAATHLVWDAFTQTDGAAVQAWSWLRVPVVEPHKLYNVIGYASSIGGLLVIAAAIATWYRRTPPIPDRGRALRGRQRWMVVGGLASTIALGIAIGLSDPVIHVSGYDLVRRILIGAVQGGTLGLLLYAAIWQLSRPRYRGRDKLGLAGK